ncbi:MAG: hypothetical protein DME62_10215 [Verrucomicrobia bacterium]|nr:MAG: hypothetical protein DME62_10215 [Verrucomicrobiota bacterium]
MVLVASGLAFVPVQSSDAQIYVGIPGIAGVGIGGGYYGYPAYSYSGYYPYGYYRPYYYSRPYYSSYYSGPSYYWYNGHRVYYRHYRHHHYYHSYFEGLAKRYPICFDTSADIRDQSVDLVFDSAMCGVSERNPEE